MLNTGGAAFFMNPPTDPYKPLSTAYRVNSWGPPRLVWHLCYLTATYTTKVVAALATLRSVCATDYVHIGKSRSFSAQENYHKPIFFYCCTHPKYWWCFWVVWSLLTLTNCLLNNSFFFFFFFNLFGTSFPTTHTCYILICRLFTYYSHKTFGEIISKPMTRSLRKGGMWLGRRGEIRDCVLSSSQQTIGHMATCVVSTTTWTQWKRNSLLLPPPGGGTHYAGWLVMTSLKCVANWKFRCGREHTVGGAVKIHIASIL